VLAAIFQPSLWIVAMVIALVNWVQTARVIYTETSSLPSATSSPPNGRWAPAHGRILFRHILPHLVPTIIVWGTLGISTTVLLEATLSFLGIGVQPPTPSWGNIIFEKPDLLPDRALAGLHSPAPRSSCWRWPSTWSATRCATCSTRRSGGATDGRLSARRLVQSALILLGVSFITFVLLYVLPADPVRQIAGRSRHGGNGREHPPAARPRSAVPRAIRRYLGAWCRATWAAATCRRPRSPTLIWSRLPATLLLMAGAIFCELVLGLTMGIVAALKRGRRGRPGADDDVLRRRLGAAVRGRPAAALCLCGAKLGWFPIGGYGTAAIWCCRR
jgi:hypothetical protein